MFLKNGSKSEKIYFPFQTDLITPIIKLELSKFEIF